MGDDQLGQIGMAVERGFEPGELFGLDTASDLAGRGGIEGDDMRRFDDLLVIVGQVEVLVWPSMPS
ncbi:hypothetical protein [Devosia ginsengisoli]|uniref:hypothetical protein n=1 Tax=Devosia ginsengisoli TaxID=400770 RepID=UPI0026EB9423|nr:hypothetical protein [Devosia ginsengisoli]MCR6673992.1 hypothetical protein [Devosia ginsengisoli]